MMTDSDRLMGILNQLLSLPREMATVEFKSNWDWSDDIGEYVSALANSAALELRDRAWMVWGVNNTTLNVTGTMFNPFEAKGAGRQPLIMWLTQLISPRPDFQFHEIPHHDGRVVMLEIHPPRIAPLAFKGVRYIRIDSHRSILSKHPAKEARLWEVLGGVEDWSGHVVPDATLNDLDPKAITFARTKFAEYLIKNEMDSGQREKITANVKAWDTRTLLNKARITKQDRITRSALLLLGCDEAAHFLAPSDVKISWILHDEKNRPAGGQHFSLPLLLAPDALFKNIRNITLEHMPDGTLFPTPISQYDPWVIREALHNCIAHQDYRLAGKINVVEHPDRLVFSNLGIFIPQSVEWMLEHQSPPELYRNQWLVEGMVRLRMIDQIGSGIRRMFETQRERLFPLPDYTIDSEAAGKPRVEVSIPSKILDARYTQLLMRRPELTLKDVLLLDRIQKKKRIEPAMVRKLKAAGLIEGRSPNYYISAQVAEWSGQKAHYMHNRILDDEYYRHLVFDYLEKYERASRKDLDSLLLPKLSELLTPEQKQHKIKNIIQTLRRNDAIRNIGSNKSPSWILAGAKFISKMPSKNDD